MKRADGKDVIYGFEDNDKLTLDGLAFTSSYNQTTGVLKLKFDGGSITFKDFSATTFNIDGTNYTLSGKKLK